ncbi:porin [Aliidiomarina halalkaliphila]|uniref:Porin n=1 Tax=Aliidiomarina halalkaliphila TaxID=2593535 RepID=A0A552WZC3_9GAMM|nr:porin [Aliidiomarina halalkaliphila]TRW48094.1 porin [Aliidiomarina halalkaliphila]
MRMPRTRSCLISLFAVVTPVLFTASPVAATETPTDFKFYGRLHVSADYLNDGNDGGLNLSSNSSRIGLSVMHGLANDLMLLGQIERTVQVTDGDATLSARNTFVGIRGDWGTLRGGYIDTPVKRILNHIELFRDRVGEGRNVTRSGEMHFDRRFRNGVQYLSPVWNNLSAVIHFGAGETTDVSTTTRDDEWSTMVQWNQGAWTTQMGYEVQGRDELSDLRALRVGSVYRAEAWTTTLFFQNARGLTTGDVNVYGVGTVYQWNDDYQLKGQVFVRDSRDMENDDGYMVTLGIDRRLSTQAMAYFAVSAAQNDDNARVNVSAGGHGKTLTISPGDDPYAVSVGLVWNF